MNDQPNNNPKDNSIWEKYIPWFLTITSFLALISIGLFLITNINWYKEEVFQNVPDSSLEYRMYAHQVHLGMINRSVGLFSGFALMFIGSGVAFYSVKKQTKLDLKSSGITANLLTASPGIIAMILGVALIIATIKTKNEYAVYQDTNQYQQSIPAPEKPGR